MGITGSVAVKLLTDTYFPTLFEQISDNELRSNSYFSVADESQAVFINLEKKMTDIDDIYTISEYNELIAAMTDYSTQSASVALKASIPGEKYLYEYIEYDKINETVSMHKIVSAKKFIKFQEVNTEPAKCGYGGESVVIPHTFYYSLDIRETFVCTLLASTNNRYVDKEVERRSLASDDSKDKKPKKEEKPKDSEDGKK